jgi:hypothetical protein
LIAHPDDGFTRLALALQMGWAADRLNGSQRAVLDVLAIETWGRGRQGYTCRLTAETFAERSQLTHRAVNGGLRHHAKRRTRHWRKQRERIDIRVPVKTTGGAPNASQFALFAQRMSLPWIVRRSERMIGDAQSLRKAVRFQCFECDFGFVMLNLCVL